MFTLMLPVLLMMVGLAIDRTMLFIVEAKLDSAVDGAALGAGDCSVRRERPTLPRSRVKFLSANFPTGVLGKLLPHAKHHVYRRV